MSARRSRLSVKPNLGPKVAPGTKSTAQGPKTTGKGSAVKQKEPSPNDAEKEKVTASSEETSKVESPKKELRKLLMKRVGGGDEETDIPESTTSVPVNTQEKITGTRTETDNEVVSKGMSSSDKNELPKSGFVDQPCNSTSNNEVTIASEEIKESAGKEDVQLPPSTREEVDVNKTNQVSAPPKPNKVGAVTRNRLPKARPNLSDAGRPKKISNTQLSTPLSPLKSPRPAFCQSPIKTLSGSPEKIPAAARNLHFQHPQEKNTTIDDLVIQNQNEEKRLQGDSESPRVERRVRHQSSNDSQAQAEKRQRHASISEVVPAKRKKPPKVDIPNDKPADKSKLKMRDLIYWNPINNPMKNSSEKQKKGKTATDRITMMEESAASLTTPTQEEIAADDPEPMSGDEAMPVPQVKIGPDGNIILNEESLVIKNDKKVIEEDDVDTIDETDSNVTYTSFRQKRNKRSWTEKETAKFYKALSYMGTDFSLILRVFPDRSRDDIKKKFSIEDRKNRMKVEDALRNKMPFDLSAFENEETETETVKTKKPRKKREAKPKATKPKAKPMEWKKYYEGPETKDKESKEERLEFRRKQVEEARKRLAERNSQSVENPDAPFIPPSARGSEDPKEVVEILMSMSEAKNSSTENKQDNPLSSLNSLTSANNLGQILQQSGQTALLGDENNGPFILVYSHPQDASGETVIHVYRIQREEIQGLTGQPEQTVNPGTSVPVTSTSNRSLISTSQTNTPDDDVVVVSNKQPGNIAPENVFTPIEAPIRGSADAVIQAGNITAVTYSDGQSQEQTIQNVPLHNAIQAKRETLVADIAQPPEQVCSEGNRTDIEISY